MDIRKLQRTIIDALEDVKAQDIRVYDTIGLSDLFDRVILASGSSNRQTRALAWRVAEEVKQSGGEILSVEGTDGGEWVLVDAGDIVVHIMLPPARAYFALEELWGDKPVRLRKPAGKAAEASAAAHAADPSTPTVAKVAKTKVATKAKATTTKATKAVVTKAAVAKAAAKQAAAKRARTRAPRVARS
jgi:ribosome-associated protein